MLFFGIFLAYDRTHKHTHYPMKKIMYFFVYLSALSIAAQTTNVNTLLNTTSKLQLSFTSAEIQLSTIEHRAEFYTQISVDGLTKSYDIGNPDLPVFSKLIEVPTSGDLQVNIIDSSKRTIDLAAIGFPQEIYPSQVSVFKNQDPSKIPFTYNENSYSSNEFYSQDLVKIERLGIMRGKSIARIQIAPFAYNAVINQLEVTEDLVFSVDFENVIKLESKALKSQDFDINFSKLVNSSIGEKHEFSTNTTGMIILSDPMFEEDLQDFISWKRKKGFEVIEAYKGSEEVGSTVESMKAYVQSFYDNATADNPAPTYLLIVGDHEQVPSFDAGDHVSDMYYCEFDGNGDYFPEMIFGRFSASTSAELLIQIDKTLQYEQYTMANPSYLSEVLMVAGVDGNFAPTHGNGQINYGTDYYFNAEHDLSPYVYLYPETNSNAVETAIIEHVSQGVGFANYTAHCSPAGWSDPSFELSDVAGLNNEDEYGLMVGNCCQSNTFNGVTCFGESLLRKSKGGAVGYIGGSNNTLWDEDYYWGVGNGPISANPTYEETGLAVYDCSFHENNEQTSDWSITQGQLLQSGNWAVTESGSGNTQYYWEIYHLMGDPSVLTYFGVPSVLTVSHPEALVVGMSTIAVSTEQYTYVAISQNGVLLDALYTDESGDVTLSFDPLNTMDNLDVVATKQNKQPYTGQVNMMSSNAPYIACSSIAINDGLLGNNEVEYNETFSLGLNLQNYGAVASSPLSVDISSSNPNITLSYDSLNTDSIPAESFLQLDDLVTVSLNGNFMDQEIVALQFTIVDEDGTEWVSTNSFVVNAPQLEFSSSELSSGNSTISLGESVDVIFTLENVGHATCESGGVAIDSEFPSLTIDVDEVPFSAIESNSQYTVTIPVTLEEDAPLGVQYSISLSAVSFDNFNADYTVEFSSPNCSLESVGVQINLTSDYYAHETAWTLTDAAGVVVGEVELGSLNSEEVYEDVFCMEPNSYCTFAITDSYGDGLTSEGYSVVVCDQVVASGSNFGSSETVGFIAGCDQSIVVGCTDSLATNYSVEAVIDNGSCLYSGVGLSELINDIRVYPNPSVGILKIDAGAFLIKTVSIKHMDGKEVMFENSLGDDFQLDISNLDPGYYLVVTHLENGMTFTKPIMLM